MDRSAYRHPHASRGERGRVFESPRNRRDRRSARAASAGGAARRRLPDRRIDHAGLRLSQPCGDAAGALRSSQDHRRARHCNGLRGLRVRDQSCVRAHRQRRVRSRAGDCRRCPHAQRRLQRSLDRGALRRWRRGCADRAQRAAADFRYEPRLGRDRRPVSVPHRRTSRDQRQDRRIAATAPKWARSLPLGAGKHSGRHRAYSHARGLEASNRSTGSCRTARTSG